jgi:tRNA U34 5-carboxymethylaminomethyl modifying GTPase MnmE/TrmE
MDNNSLDIVLKECEEYAKIGYKIASDKQAELNKVLNSAAKKIDSALSDFEKSPCYFSGATDLLSQQLIGIRTSFDSLSTSFQNDLRLLSKNMSKFSITLFGRTMAGKSTLMEILTQGDGQSIGKGAQRTTRDVRKYTWKNMEITDVPGIGAFEGEEDEQIAFEAAKTADLILFLLSDDGPQAKDAECFAKIFTLGKPVVCVMNVKASVSESKSMKMNLLSSNRKMVLLRMVCKEGVSRAVQIANHMDYQFKSNRDCRVAQLAIVAQLFLQLLNLCNSVIILLHWRVVTNS